MTNKNIEAYEYGETLNQITSLEAARFRLIESKANTDRSLMVIDRKLKTAKREAERMAIERGLDAVEDDTPKSRIAPIASFVLLAVIAMLAVRFWPSSGPVEAASAQEVIMPVEQPIEAAYAPMEATAPQTLTAETLADYVAKYNPALAPCVDGIMEYSRPALAVAIVRQETSMGTNIRSGRHNVGNIMSHKAGKKWKDYATMCEGLEDVAYLLDTPSYANLSVDEVGNRYCGEGCEDWLPNVTSFLAEITL